MSEKSFKLEVEKGIIAVLIPGSGIRQITKAELDDKTGGLLVYWLTTSSKEDCGYWGLEEYKGGFRGWILSTINTKPVEVKVVLNSVTQLKFVEDTQNILTIVDC